jgi:hypothetical protein
VFILFEKAVVVRIIIHLMQAVVVGKQVNPHPIQFGSIYKYFEVLLARSSGATDGWSRRSGHRRYHSTPIVSTKQKKKNQKHIHPNRKINNKNGSNQLD